MIQPPFAAVGSYQAFLPSAARSVRALFGLGLIGALILPGALRAAEPTAAESPAAASKPSNALSPEANTLLVAAGNAATDEERLALLQDLQKRTDLPEDFREDLGMMVAYVNRWANGYDITEKKDRYLILAMHPVAQGKEYAPRRTNNPILKALIGYYMGRARLQGYIQTGHGAYLNLSPEDRLKADNYRLSLFQKPAETLKDNPILKMYTGHPIPWPAELEVPVDPQAPEWANLQRQGLEKLAQVMQWWIDNRQKPEGFFGSGWGDDVELWRTFVPLTVAFQDPALVESQRILSEAIFAQPHMKEGFSSLGGKGMDAEHISEDSADTVTPMLFLAPGDEVWRKRALVALDLAKEKWSGINQRGQLQFRSTYFNAKGIHFEGVQPPDAQSTDTIYHGRALQPALILWQQGLAPEVGEFVLPWMDTWVDASMREEKGKPAGIVPTTIHWPDGAVGGVSPEWWKPGNFHITLYDWPSALPIILDAMLLSHTMTGERRYLEPLFAMARYRRDFLAGKLGDPSVAGSAAWAASKMSFLMPVLAKYRLLTGDKQFDDLLQADASGYVNMRLTGDRSKLIEDLRRNAAAFSVNFPVYTTECRAGDRVMAGPARYFSLPILPQPMAEPKVASLYESATGNPSISMYGLTNGVRWLTPPKEIAALVTESTMQKFAAELYHFGDKARNMDAELLALDRGDYTVTLKEAGDGGKVLASERLRIGGEAARQKLILPARTLCTLTVERAKS